MNVGARAATCEGGRWRAWPWSDAGLRELQEATTSAFTRVAGRKRPRISSSPSAFSLVVACPSPASSEGATTTASDGRSDAEDDVDEKVEDEEEWDEEEDEDEVRRSCK